LTGRHVAEHALREALEHLFRMFRSVPAAHLKGGDVLRYATLRLEEKANPATRVRASGRPGRMSGC
jgi:hypothetical protein